MSILHSSPNSKQLNLKRKWKLVQNPKFSFIILCIVIFIIIHLIIIHPTTNYTKSNHCRLPIMRFSYQSSSFEDLPTIYVITPTYERYVQKAELTRLSHTFMLVPRLHWIIVEDSPEPTILISRFILRLKNEFDFTTVTCLYARTPDSYKRQIYQPSWRLPRGVWQRNKALEWIRDNLDSLDENGVIYFADDDNTYDLELFNEMRYTSKVSVWPVGLVGELLVEKPIVRANKINSFNAVWANARPYPIDMAGFAISIKLFTRHKDVKFSADQRVGYLESHFLSQLIKSWDDLEPKANNCTKILVWHTKTKNPELRGERKLSKPSTSDMEL